MSAIRSLSAEKRTSRGHPISVAIDPERGIEICQNVSPKRAREPVPFDISMLLTANVPVRTDRDQAAVQCFRSCDPGDIYPYDDRSASVHGQLTANVLRLPNNSTAESVESLGPRSSRWRKHHAEKVYSLVRTGGCRLDSADCDVRPRR